MEELTNRIQLKNAYPVTDEVGETSKPFRFKLTNTCGVGVDYDLNLEVMGLAYEKSESNPEGTVNRIASKNIATKVDELEKTILNPELYPEKVKVATPTYNQESDPAYDSEDYTAVEAYTLYSGEIKPYDSVTHEIRIWLDASAGNDSQNGSFYSKVVIEAKQNQAAVQSFSDYIIAQMKEDTSIEVFEQVETAQTNALTDYRYVGSSPDNYVYFGCEGNEENPCTNDNLYRIIGVIPTQSEIGGEYENRAKLIKANYYIENESKVLRSSKYTESKYGYYYDEKYSNNWATTALNTKVINGVYWKNLGDYQNYISSVVWYLGAPYYNDDQSYTPKGFYQAERSDIQGSSNGAISYIDNVGLMYPSDYGYSIGKDFQNESVYSNRALYQSNAWLYNGKNANYEWVLNPEQEAVELRNTKSYAIFSDGSVQSYCVWCSSGLYEIRPTFYLKSNVIYESGEGTQDNPFRIAIANE